MLKSIVLIVIIVCVTAVVIHLISTIDKAIQRKAIMKNVIKFEKAFRMNRKDEK